jgi:hypothetical protein
MVKNGRLDTTLKPFGIPMMLRVSANKWYLVFWAMGGKLNNQRSEPKIRINKMT